MTWFVVDCNDAYPEREVWAHSRLDEAVSCALAQYTRWTAMMRERSAQLGPTEASALLREADSLVEHAEQLRAHAAAGLVLPQVRFSAVPGAPHDVRIYHVERWAEIDDVHCLPRHRLHVQLPRAAETGRMPQLLFAPRTAGA